MIETAILIAGLAHSAELRQVTVNCTNQANVPAAILNPALPEAAWLFEKSGIEISWVSGSATANFQLSILATDPRPATGRFLLGFAHSVEENGSRAAVLFNNIRAFSA